MKEKSKDTANEAVKVAVFEADRAPAESMIKAGEMSLEKIARYVPSVSMEELKEIDAKNCRPFGRQLIYQCLVFRH